MFQEIQDQKMSLPSANITIYIFNRKVSERLVTSERAFINHYDISYLLALFLVIFERHTCYLLKRDVFNDYSLQYISISICDP